MSDLAVLDDSHVFASCEIEDCDIMVKFKRYKEDSLPRYLILYCCLSFLQCYVHFLTVKVYIISNYQGKRISKKVVKLGHSCEAWA